MCKLFVINCHHGSGRLCVALYLCVCMCRYSIYLSSAFQLPFHATLIAHTSTNTQNETSMADAPPKKKQGGGSSKSIFSITPVLLNGTILQPLSIRLLRSLRHCALGSWASLMSRTWLSLPDIPTRLWALATAPDLSELESWTTRQVRQH